MQIVSDPVLLAASPVAAATKTFRRGDEEVLFSGEDAQKMFTSDANLARALLMLMRMEILLRAS